MSQCDLFTEAPYVDQYVSLVQLVATMLIDAGLTINTVCSSGLFSKYVSQSTSGVAIRSVTGKIFKPTDEGIVPFPVNDGSDIISVHYLHIPNIKSSIMSPAATCES
jgi:hypothetical protein